MRKFTILFVLVFALASLGNAQLRQSGIDLSSDPSIIEVQENAKWLNKEGRTNPLLNSKSVYFYEGFEAPTSDGALPEGWTQKRTTTLLQEPTTDAVAPRWFRNSASYGFENWADYVYSGAASMATGYTAEDFTWAITPAFTIAESEGDINLSYWVWYNNAQGWFTNYYVRIKADGVWTTLLSFVGNADNSNQFATQVVQSLNAFKGKEVQLAFIYEYTDGWQMAIDDVYVGETLEDDFGVELFNAYPYFGLLEGDEVAVSAYIYSGGINDGTVEVSLLVNGEVADTYTTGMLAIDGDSEYVEFIWTAPAPGDYTLAIQLPSDDFVGNNYASKDIFINSYLNIAEDFENYEYDELGIPTYVWPPVGWTTSYTGTGTQWVGPTDQWPIFDDYSARLGGRPEAGEQFIRTLPVQLTPSDMLLTFYLEGINNNVDVSPDQYPGATPPGIQGYSTFQLKYAASLAGPWTNLGDPIEFKNVYDEEDNLIQGANALRYVEQDISALSGTVYFAFTTTSTFELVIGTTVYQSHVMVDNILITDAEATEVTFTVVDGDENPLEDAVIQIFNADDLLVTTLTTDEDGVALGQLIQGDYSYVAMRLGFEAAEDVFTVGEEPTSVDITMTAAAEVYTISFAVTDGENPLAGAEITLFTLNGVTDEAGEAAFEGFAPGEYSYTVALEGYFPEAGTVVVVDEDVLVPLTLTAIPVYSITFTVTDGENPVVGASITIGSLTDVTDESGEVTFEGFAAGTYEYEVTATGFHPATSSVEVVDQDVSVPVTLTPISSVSVNGQVSLTLYPNPASSWVKIQTQSRINSLQVFNVLGTLVHHRQVGESQTEVDLSDLANGIYIVRVATEDGVAVQRLRISK